jgi:hypothetical protein
MMNKHAVIGLLERLGLAYKAFFRRIEVDTEFDGENPAEAFQLTFDFDADQGILVVEDLRDQGTFQLTFEPDPEGQLREPSPLRPSPPAVLPLTAHQAGATSPRAHKPYQYP